MSNGQLLEDVRLALNGVRRSSSWAARGNVPSHEEVLAWCARWREITARSRVG